LEASVALRKQVKMPVRSLTLGTVLAIVASVVTLVFFSPAFVSKAAATPPSPVYAGSTSDLQNRVVVSPHGAWHAVLVNANSSGQAFLVSSDGTTWQTVATPSSTFVRVLAINDSGELYTATTDTTETWWKRPAGGSWSAMAMGATVGSNYVAAIVTDDSNLIVVQNFTTGTSISNLVTSKLNSGAAQVKLSAGSATVIFDVTGYYTSVATSTYTYDEANQLTSAVTPSGSGTYGYNGDGLRTSKTVSGVTSHYTWHVTAGPPLLLSDDANYYVYDNNDLPLEQINATTGTVTWLHTDQIGSTRLLTDNTGAVVGTNTYDPYGTRTATSGSVTSPLGYAGQYTDAETGLIYLRARYYDPSTAQFLSIDPALSLSGAPYNYADNNPINSSDPSGLFGFSVRRGLKGDANFFAGIADFAVSTATFGAKHVSAPFCDVGGYSAGRWYGFIATGVVGFADVLPAKVAELAVTEVGDLAADSESGWFSSRLAEMRANPERGSIGLPGACGYTPSGGAADFDLDELAQLARSHAGADDMTRPSLSEIRRVLDRGSPTPLDGQNAVQLDYKGVHVIINEDMPWRSTAYYPGR